MNDEVIKAAIWFLRDKREEGMTLPEIVNQIWRAYQSRGVVVDMPADHYPDTVTEWLADCWEAFGLHSVDAPQDTSADIVKLPHKGRAK